MLTKKLKQDWIEALESGTYKRGRGRLYDEETNKHCCLGVLVEVHPDFKIVDDGMSCARLTETDITQDYFYLNEILGKENVTILYKKNDYNDEYLSQTYEAVLPIIKSLPTSD